MNDSVIAQVPASASAPATATATAALVTPTAGTAGREKAQGRHEAKMDKSTKVETSPDAALIEYLGEYGDAADGLDPMGLIDPDAPPVKSGGDKE